MDLQKLKSDVIILQLKVNNPELVINDMKSLVNKIQSSLPGTKLGISHAPPQRNNTNMNHKIRVVNATLDLLYQNSPVMTYSNQHMIYASRGMGYISHAEGVVCWPVISGT